ncbi:PhzF family phenazine biosynthesis protein [Castellaniella daejeonensis]
MHIHRIAAFTHDLHGGNPAGVVLSDAPLPAARMQRLANEIGYSETAFATPGSDGWDVRYFSPETEVPFCGHATIALGSVLAQQIGPGVHVLNIPAGRISVEGGVRDGRPYSELESPATKQEPVSDAVIAEALTLFGHEARDLDPGLPVLRAHAGADHLILPLRDRGSLARMTYDLDAGRRFMREQGFVTIALVWREAERIFHARNAFASGGVLEDPATGAAAAALAGMLRDRGLLRAGELLILQGEDMGWPSRLDVRFTDIPGSGVRVGGESAPLPDPQTATAA